MDGGVSYEDDRRLFAVMRNAGWTHDGATGGFIKPQQIGAALWVSWDQAMDALRLADEGEEAAGMLPQSRTLATIMAKVSNEP